MTRSVDGYDLFWLEENCKLLQKGVEYLRKNVARTQSAEETLTGLTRDIEIIKTEYTIAYDSRANGGKKADTVKAKKALEEMKGALNLPWIAEMKKRKINSLEGESLSSIFKEIDSEARGLFKVYDEMHPISS